MSRFIAKVADCAGIYSETSCTDYAHALGVLAVLATRYPTKFVFLVNQDNVDVDCGDGLTEDERDGADSAVYNAKHAPVSASVSVSA